MIFEHNDGTLTHSTGGLLFNLKPNDKVYLTGGTINGTAFGNEKGGYVKISDGVWNGNLWSVKEVNISGGRLENCKAVHLRYMRSAEPRRYRSAAARI